MNAAWKIIRPLNLGMIALTFLIIRYFLLLPVSDKFGIILSLDGWQYAVLALSVLLITAGGYIINDIRDIDADRINKPGKQWVGTHMTLSSAWTLYIMLTAAGLLTGALSCWFLGRFSLIGIHIFAAVMLYLYAGFLRRQAIAGNVVVSLLIGISVLVPALFEPSLYDLRRAGDYYAAGYTWTWIAGLAAFSVLYNFPRELIKDLEDMEGDSAAGYATFPIIAGERATRVLVLVWMVLVSLSVVWVVRYLWLEYSNWSYAVFGILILSGSLWVLNRVRVPLTKGQLSAISLVCKLIMLAGLLVLPVHHLFYQ